MAEGEEIDPITQPIDNYFKSLSVELFAGWEQLGFFGKIGRAFEVSVRNLVKWVVKFLLGIGEPVAIGLTSGVLEGEKDTDDTFRRLAAIAVEDLLDVKVDRSSFGKKGRGARGNSAGRAIGASVLQALTGTSSTAGGGEMQPSLQPAEEYLGTVMNLALEGWYEGFVMEAASLGQFETFGELDDILAKVLGLERMSRRVMGPMADALIVTPAEWQINKTYRHKLLPIAAAVRDFNRGRMPEAELRELLARNGFTDRAMEAIILDGRKDVSPADARLMVDMGLWQREDAIQELRDAGHDAARAELFLNLEEAKLLRRFQLELADAAADAYADRRIDEGRLLELLGSVDLDNLTRNRLHELASQKRLVRTKQLSRADVEQAVEHGILSYIDYQDWLENQGYDRDDALTLELMLRAKQQQLEDARTARAKAAAERAATKAARQQELEAKRAELADDKNTFSGTLTQAEQLVERGTLSPSVYMQVLVDRGLSPTDASALAELAAQKAQAFAAAARRREAAAAKAGQPMLSLATLEEAVKRGRLSIEAYRGELLDRGFDGGDAQLLVDNLNDEIAHEAAAEQQRAAAKARLTERSLSLGQAEAAVRLGTQSIEGYRAFLQREGFNQADQATLIALLTAKMRNDVRAETLHAAAAIELEKSKLSLAQEEAAVKNGLKSFDDYQAFLRANGFTADDVDVLTTLLALKLGLLEP